LIKSKGKIINIGSLAGRIAPPFSAPYSSSKFALEGLTDTLRREMNPFGIKTIIFEPSAIATPIWNKIRDENYSFVDKKYEKTKNLFLKNFVEGGNNGLSPDIAATKIFKILIKKNNKVRYIISKNILFEIIKILIPAKIMDFLIRKLFKMDY
jgi:short-subunit dehydrogenase